MGTSDSIAATVDTREERRQDHTFTVPVPVIIPPETWAHICRCEWLDPNTTDPEDVREHVDDLIDLNFVYRVGYEERNGESLLPTRKEMRAKSRNDLVANLPTHQRVVFKIVEEHEEIMPGELYEEYEDRIGDPRTDRTILNYLRKLEDYGLIEARGRSRNRMYRVSAETPVRED